MGGAAGPDVGRPRGLGFVDQRDNMMQSRGMALRSPGPSRPAEA